MIDANKRDKDLKKIINAISEEANSGIIKELMAIGFNSIGEPFYYYSGNWHNLAKAASFLNLEFTKRAFEE